MKKLALTLLICSSSLLATAAPVKYASVLVCDAYNSRNKLDHGRHHMVLYTRLEKLMQKTQDIYLVNFELIRNEFNNQGGNNSISLSQDGKSYSYFQLSCDSDDDVFTFKLKDLSLDSLKTSKMILTGTLNHSVRDSREELKLICTAK